MASPLLILLKDRSYWKSRSVVSLFATGVLLNLAGWAWVLFVIKPTQDAILLHYTVQSGVDKYGSGILSYAIPGIALGILLLNAFLGALLYKHEKFMSYFLLAAALFLQALFFVGVVTVSLASA